jgi:hypothetical protein
LPVVAPVGTVVLILVAVQFVEGETVAVVPLNLIVLAPCVEPKPVPVTVTDVPTAPVEGDKLVILGAATTVNVVPALVTPATVTVTLPVVAPVGTVVVSVVEVAAVTVAVVVLNLTVFADGVVEKFVPVMVTEAPIAPVVGDNELIVGVRRTVKAMPLLLTPLALMTTLPVDAPVGTVVVMLVAVQLVDGRRSLPFR